MMSLHTDTTNHTYQNDENGDNLAEQYGNETDDSLNSEDEQKFFDCLTVHDSELNSHGDENFSSNSHVHDNVSNARFTESDVCSGSRVDIADLEEDKGPDEDLPDPDPAVDLVIEQAEEAAEEERREKEESVLSEDVIESRRKECLNLKEAGNKHFQHSEFSEAIENYSKALHICPIRLTNERSIMFSNRAACYIKLENNERGLKDCNAALKLNPQYMKCLVRRAELNEKMDKLEEALQDYNEILKLNPNCQKSRAACAILPERIKDKQEKMKAEMMGQLKKLGNLVLNKFGLSTDNFKFVQDPNSGGYSVNFQR